MDTICATSMDTSSTQWDQMTTQVKRLDYSTHTYAKSSLIKTSTAELDTLQVAPWAEHIVDRDSPDDG